MTTGLLAARRRNSDAGTGGLSENKRPPRARCVCIAVRGGAPQHGPDEGRDAVPPRRTEWLCDCKMHSVLAQTSAILSRSALLRPTHPLLVCPPPHSHHRVCCLLAVSSSLRDGLPPCALPPRAPTTPVVIWRVQVLRRARRPRVVRTDRRLVVVEALVRHVQRGRLNAATRRSVNVSNTNRPGRRPDQLASGGVHRALPAATERREASAMPVVRSVRAALYGGTPCPQPCAVSRGSRRSGQQIAQKESTCKSSVVIGKQPGQDSRRQRRSQNTAQVSGLGLQQVGMNSPS